MLKIVILDDSISTCTVVKHILNNIGYRDITVSYSWNNCEEQLLSKIYNIALIDIILHNVQGITCIKKIHEIQKECKIIAMSVRSDPIIIKKAFINGANYYLSKPFEEHELHAAIDTIIKKIININ